MSAKLICSLAAMTLLVAPPVAAARIGVLSQLPGKAGCVADVRTGGPELRRGCALARLGSGQPQGIAISSDGRSAYVASDGALASFRIVHGRLRGLRGRAACFRRDRRFGCKRVPLLGHVESVVLSRDGRSVYVGASSGPRGYVLAFSRNRRSGALKRLAGRGGCIGSPGGACASARGLSSRVELAMSPDGRSIYVTSTGEGNPGTVVLLARRLGGRLSQLRGSSGCMNQGGENGCATARGVLRGCCAVSVSPDSRYVYASSTGGSQTEPGVALAAFQRDAVSGGLTQLAGSSGCVADLAANGCAVVAFRASSPANFAGGVTFSPDGRSLYLTHGSIIEGAEPALCGTDDDFLALFTRDPATGALGPLAQDRGVCGGGTAVSPDGRNVYTLAGSSGDLVSVLARDRGTGLLTSAGCAGPFERSCRKTRHMDAPIDMAITADGRYAYVVTDALGTGTIAVFRRSTR